MCNNRPVTQSLFGAAPGKTLGLRASWLFLLGAALLATTGLHAQTAAKAAPKAEASSFVGSETCATCHEEVAKKFDHNVHNKAAAQRGGVTVTCENCHGAGKAHVDGGGDTSKIFNPAKASTKDVDKMCLGCHAGQHQNFERSAHAKNNVGCTSCHSVHNGDANPKLLKAEPTKLCFQCHSDVKPQFSMPFHHKVEEGLIQCSDCHDPHGTFGNKNLKSTADQNAVCTKCHTDTRGPFVFEHPVVKGQGCTSCHTPHGSANARLLNMPSINGLCTQCHSPVAAGTIHGAGAGSSSAQPCVDCHTKIHGSNISQAFIR